MNLFNKKWKKSKNFCFNKCCHYPKEWSNNLNIWYALENRIEFVSFDSKVVVKEHGRAYVFVLISTNRNRNHSWLCKNFNSSRLEKNKIRKIFLATRWRLFLPRSEKTLFHFQSWVNEYISLRQKYYKMILFLHQNTHTTNCQ